MKRLVSLILVALFLNVPTFANHITGGEMYYTLTSQNGNNFTYHVVLKLYRDCNAPPGSAELDPTANISIFNKATGASVFAQSIARTQIVILSLGSPSPCISNPPVVCYQVGYYEFDVTLPGIASGYIIAFQRCCRIAGINNLVGSNNVGTTYTAEIPGTTPVANGPANNSAKFVGADTVIVCANNAFTYSFAAIDPDLSDNLTYSFCDAYVGGAPGSPIPNPPAGPPYSSVPYNPPFNGAAPLGNNVSINPTTGLISGIAPAAGIYVVTVCVTETRQGQVIATQRKDLQIKVGDCQVARALLQPQYITCDGFTMTFSNLANSPLINSYFWDFGVPTLTNDTSNLASPTFTYPDTGTFTIKLITNRGQACSDSATAIVKVYPGFFPGFETIGVCYLQPIQFRDTTRTRYGIVDSWSWNFGDLTTLADTSHLQNPQWLYAGPGTKDVTFIVTNSKGCKDTLVKTITLLDKPVITLAFRDTLICIRDNVQLLASGTGNFSWTPLINIVNPNTATPTVNPPTTTTYTVTLNDQGCVNRDSVKVRVIDIVSVRAMGDTTICRTDQVQLTAVTDGLTFLWSPAATLNNPNVLNPVATPTAVSTTYTIRSSVGSCFAFDDVIVTTVPYPVADAGQPVTICYNTTTQLNGSHNGTSFTWSPVAYLNNPNILNPIATPPRTTPFILSSFDPASGCPKPGRDTVIVTVLPKILPFAGRDTAVVIGQPLQFNASGGINYAWSPPTGLSNTTISNPVGIYDGSIDSIRYKVIVYNEAGCADSAYVRVKIFKTAPTIFVPSAFTPNNDGLNDRVRPIAVGIERIQYFKIFNRWGQMVFSTTTNGFGWDGKIGGVLQATNTYVWLVSAVDYLGNRYFQKGTVTLIR